MTEERETKKRNHEQVKELGRAIAGPDYFFYADPSQDFGAVHVGFFKNGKTVTKTISIAQIVNDPNLEEVLKELKNTLEVAQ